MKKPGYYLVKDKFCVHFVGNTLSRSCKYHDGHSLEWTPETMNKVDGIYFETFNELMVHLLNWEECPIYLKFFYEPV